MNMSAVDVQVSYKECRQVADEWNQLSRKASELKFMCDEEHVMFNSRKKHKHVEEPSTSSLRVYLPPPIFFLSF